MFRKKKPQIRAGFTLLEMSISVLVLSLIIAGVMTVENQRIRVEQRADLLRKLDLISKALYNYRMANSQLPCPGNSSIARSNSNFGVAANGGAGSCHTGGTINSNINSSDNKVFGGSVPVRTLGLTDDTAFDPWGSQFTYYVDKNANATNAFNGENGTDSLVYLDKLQVQDESNTTLPESALAVVISHGPNGHGGYNSAGIRINAGSTNTSELKNCMCKTDVSADAVSPIVIRIQRTLPTSATDFTTNFDDVGRFFNKSFFYTYSELHPS